MPRLTHYTTDHETIRHWAEERGGHPTSVKGTRRSGEDAGILRIDFPGYSGEGKLREVSWDKFFDKFDKEDLVFVYQEQTSRGQRSNFNKIVRMPEEKKMAQAGKTRKGASAREEELSRKRGGANGRARAGSAGTRTGTRTGGQRGGTRTARGQGRLTRGAQPELGGGAGGPVAGRGSARGMRAGAAKSATTRGRRATGGRAGSPGATTGTRGARGGTRAGGTRGGTTRARSAGGQAAGRGSRAGSEGRASPARTRGGGRTRAAARR
jgi:hypothetical protein